MRFQGLFKSVATTLGITVLAALPSMAGAQDRHPATQFGLDPGQIAAMEVGADYAYVHANAPPSQCGCFSMEGVGGGFAVNAPHGISLVADIVTAGAKNIDATTQNIRILNFLGGPRFSYRKHSRFTPYVQALFGRSLELSNETFVQNKTGFAVSGGGGVNRTLGKYIGWKIVEADYIYSQIPNALNNRQNDLRITTGIYFRFGPR
jgi:peptidoglycan-associated lipoprotein